MTWNGKRVLVTGGGGFIGSHLCEGLVKAGADVRALVHYNSAGRRGWLDESQVKDSIEVIAGDLTDRDSVVAAARNIDVIFHLGALIAIPYSYIAPESYIQVNVSGTLNVCQAARENDVQRMVHTSTSEVYGTARYVPIDEDHPLQGQSPYSASKIAADKLVESFHLSFGLPVTTARPFNTYGPRQSARAVIPTIITQALANYDEIKLGNLDPTRDLNFVSDTVEGFMRLAQSDEAVGEAVNFGTGKEISIGDLAQKIIELTGSKSIISTSSERMRKKGSEVERLLAANDKCHEMLGWTPPTSLDDGLRKTIEWLSSNKDRFRAGEYTV